MKYTQQTNAGWVDLGLPVHKMKKYLLAIIIFILLIIVLFGRRIYENITTPIYWELTNHELVELNLQRKMAYQYAVSCSEVEEVVAKFEDITWVLVPGDTLRINTTSGPVSLLGWYDIESKVIYMPFAERNTFWIMAREAMHAIGYIGHPIHPFHSCGLMATQN